MVRKLIIDTDCGSDDAMAIAMALKDPNYEVLFFTTVSGNVRLKQAIENTLTTMEYTNTYFPAVYSGEDEMLVRDWVGAYETHGNDGLGDLDYHYKNKYNVFDGAIDKIISTLNENEEKTIDIVTLGPLTNIAKAIEKDLKAINRARQITVMGSAGLGFGNVSPVAEFNIWQDAEAAKIVVEAGLDNLVFVGWDACLGESMFNEKEIKEIEESSKLGEFLIKSNRVLLQMNKERFGYPCLDMADPAAMAAALQPNCIEKCDKYYCQVDVSNGPSYGSVLVDYYHFSGKKENVWICSSLNKHYKEYALSILTQK